MSKPRTSLFCISSSDDDADSEYEDASDTDDALLSVDSSGDSSVGSSDFEDCDENVATESTSRPRWYCLVN